MVKVFFCLIMDDEEKRGEGVDELIVDVIM
jgi:hypothetical protein